MKKPIFAIIMALLLPATALMSPVQASAEDAHTDADPYYTYKVVNKVMTSDHYVDYNRKLRSCSNPGGTCTLAVTDTVSASIGASFGLSKKQIAFQLTGSFTTSRSVSASCTSPKLTVGQVFYAYPAGYRYRYQIQQYISGQGLNVPSRLSGTLYAFIPDGSIACKVRTY